MTGAGLGRFCCCSSLRSSTSSRFLLAPLLTASVVTAAGSGSSFRAGGATAFAMTLPFARVLGAGAVAVKGCCVEGGAAAAFGWAGAGLALTTGGAGDAITIPYVVAACGAVAAVEAVAMIWAALCACVS